MKLYVIVRNDLSTSQRAVQAGHALAEFILRGPFSRWNNGTLVYLGAKNLMHLEKIKYNLDIYNIPYTEFKEPDMNFETTAIACDQNCKIFKKLNLI